MAIAEMTMKTKGNEMNRKVKQHLTIAVIMICISQLIFAGCWLKRVVKDWQANPHTAQQEAIDRMFD